MKKLIQKTLAFTTILSTCIPTMFASDPPGSIKIPIETVMYDEILKCRRDIKCARNSEKSKIWFIMDTFGFCHMIFSNTNIEQVDSAVKTYERALGSMSGDELKALKRIVETMKEQLAMKKRPDEMPDENYVEFAFSYSPDQEDGGFAIKFFENYGIKLNPASTSSSHGSTEPITIVAGENKRKFKDYYDKRLDSGNFSPFIWIGPGEQICCLH